MALCHKKESIHNATVSQEGEYPLMPLCHKKESIHNATVSQEGEYP